MRIWSFQPVHSSAEVQNAIVAHKGTPADAISYVFSWADMESVKGVFDFSATDAALAGGKCLFRFQITNGAPAWVKAAVPCVNVPAGTPDAPQGAFVPVMWNATFQKLVLTFLSALSSRYNGHPNLVLVEVSGTGILAEPYLGTDVAAWEAAGWTLAVYENCLTFWINTFKRLFNKQYVSFACSDGLSGAAAGQMGRQVQIGEVQGVFVQQNGISAVSTPPSKLAIYAALGKVPLAGQMISVFSDPRMQGTGAQAVQNAIAAKLVGLEVYAQDVTNPANWAMLNAARGPRQRLGKVTRRTSLLRRVGLADRRQNATCGDRRKTQRRVNAIDRRTQPLFYP